MLFTKLKKIAAAKKAEEMENEARHQVLTEDLGKNPKEIMDDSLDKFGQVKELDDLANTLGEMMAL